MFHRWRLQSRTGSRSSGKPEDPCRTPPKRCGFLPFEKPKRMSSKRNDLRSYRVFGMRTRTRQQQASTSGGGCLAGPVRLAKSKIRAVPAVTQKNSSRPVTSRLPSSSGAQEVPMRTWLVVILAVFNVGNGLVMLFAGSMWWAHVAGARETGPLNPHFVQDVGAAFAVAGLAPGAWRPAY